MKLIQSEFFINSSDFLKEAIKDKLKEHEIIEIRELTHDKAKKRNIKLLWKNTNIWYKYIDKNQVNKKTWKQSRHIDVTYSKMESWKKMIFQPKKKLKIKKNRK